MSTRPQQPCRAGLTPRLCPEPRTRTARGGAGRLTDADGGLAPQQQLQALGAVGQAAVMQGRAALARLFVQVPTGKDGNREREQ